MKQLTLPHLRGMLQGCDIIVCGLGTSLNQLKNPEKYWTIGVNDISAAFVPDFIVCIDPLTRFKIGNRKNDIINANPKYFCSQLDPKVYTGLKAEHYVKFRLGKRMGVGFNFSQMADRLDYHNTSPYVAANLAAYLGAKRIFIIGVDLTPNHFNRKSGNHALSKRLKEIDTQYGKFANQCSSHGVSMLNLSEESKLTSLKKIEINNVNLKEKCNEKPVVLPKQPPEPEKPPAKRGGNRKPKQKQEVIQPKPQPKPRRTNRGASKRRKRN